MRTRQATSHQSLLTIAQASAEFGVPERSIYDLIARGALPKIQFPGTRRVRVKRADFERLIESSQA